MADVGAAAQEVDGEGVAQEVGVDVSAGGVGHASEESGEVVHGQSARALG